MARWLVVLALLWPLAQAAAVAATIRDSNSVVAAMVYVIGSRVCHRHPGRSFHTAGVQWPVCARCSGLYMAGALGAVLGVGARARRWTGGRRLVTVLMVASLPTAGTGLGEWVFGVNVANATRAGAALPLGAAIAASIVAVASSASRSDQVN